MTVMPWQDALKHWLLAEVWQGLAQLQKQQTALSKQLNEISYRENLQMAAIDDLQTAVTAETTVVKSAETLLGQLSDLIKAAGTDPVKLAAITSQIDANRTELAAAVVANTPGGPPLP